MESPGLTALELAKLEELLMDEVVETPPAVQREALALIAFGVDKTGPKRTPQVEGG